MIRLVSDVCCNSICCSVSLFSQAEELDCSIHHRMCVSLVSVQTHAKGAGTFWPWLFWTVPLGSSANSPAGHCGGFQHGATGLEKCPDSYTLLFFHSLCLWLCLSVHQPETVGWYMIVLMPVLLVSMSNSCGVCSLKAEQAIWLVIVCLNFKS